MVENNVLQLALWQALEAHERHAARWRVVTGDAARRHDLRLSDGGDRSPLVIGADGANSQVRQMAGIGVHAWQYQQSCMLISVQCADDPGDSTWQQFTPAARAPFCRCSTTGHRWCGTTRRRVFASCRA
jgi:2-octaprenyl-3-methyl-6-methoxy-1,4-benzoquinol hydroxylase